MAPPQTRRPGYSRRAQYSLFAAYVVAMIGVGIGLLMVITARFDPRGHAAIQQYVTDLTAPAASAARQLLDKIDRVGDGIAAYIDAGSKNQALEREARAGRAAATEAEGLKRENARLKSMLKLVETERTTIATARLIGSTATNSRRYAILSAGSNAGVADGQPVRTPEGLVGRVVATGRISARVLLIIDGGNVVPVKRLSDGRPALATGRGDGGMDIRALDSGINPFKRGDVFVTSGAGGIYPPDVPVAVAVIDNREMAVGRPVADPRRLDMATVISPYIAPDPALPPEPKAP